MSISRARLRLIVDLPIPNNISPVSEPFRWYAVPSPNDRNPNNMTPTDRFRFVSEHDLGADAVEMLESDLPTPYETVCPKIAQTKTERKRRRKKRKITLTLKGWLAPIA